MLVGSVPGNLPGVPTGDLQYEKAVKKSPEGLDDNVMCPNDITTAYSNIWLNKSITNF